MSPFCTSKDRDPVQAILEATDGRGVDVAIEALGTQATFESCLRVLRSGGVLSSLGSTRASSRCRSTPLRQDSATTPSPRPFVQEGKSGCAGS